MLIPRDQNQVNHALKFLIFALMVMVALGGTTRLTGSGLSITEWDLLWGILPPLSETAWLDLFAKYQKTPEFIQNNSWMKLPDFQRIFWLEYIHRLWGRGLVFILMFLHWRARMSTLWSQYYWPRVYILWALLLIQGLAGWYMVKSGLVDNPFVSPYRLSLHLTLAGAMLLLALAMIRIDQYDRFPMSRKLPCTATIVVGLTVIWGSLVAGHKAGYIYNSFPLMDGHWLPPELFQQSSWWRAIFTTPEGVQFVHRILATVSLVVTLFLVRALWLRREHTRALKTLALICTQYLLGILTLLLNVPLMLGALHQLVAFILLAWLAWLTRCAKFTSRSII